MHVSRRVHDSRRRSLLAGSIAWGDQYSFQREVNDRLALMPGWDWYSGLSMNWLWRNAQPRGNIGLKAPLVSDSILNSFHIDVEVSFEYSSFDAVAKQLR